MTNKIAILILELWNFEFKITSFNLFDVVIAKSIQMLNFSISWIDKFMKKIEKLKIYYSRIALRLRLRLPVWRKEVTKNYLICKTVIL